MTERVCVLLHVRPGRLDEYVAAHQSVWPEMLEALSRSGWQNYSLFLRERDGLVVGYFETEDADEAFRAMDAEPVNERWQSTMACYFQPGTDGVNGDESERLRNYFYLA